MSTGFTDDPDVRVMLAVRSGEHAAFAELVERHGAFLVSFIYKFVGSQATAEDLAQEAFFKAFRAAPTYEPTAKFKTWLLTIASNLCMNRKRWEKKRQHLSLDAPADRESGRSLSESVADDGEGPMGGIDRDERRTMVRRAIVSLPENQRLAVILARYHELSYAQIAESMGMTIMAVKSLLNRAKENLKERLSQELEREALAHEPPALTPPGI
jgi:RNA polymerase sigma-70 factor, ECF subfamily